MKVGRPRSRTPEPEELVKLGEDLIEWACEKCDEVRSRFCEWYSIKQGLSGDQWELMIRKPEFIGYYEQAQALLAKKWINEMNPSIAHRFIRIYCPEVKKSEDEKTLYDYKAKAEAEAASLKANLNELEEKYQAVMEQITLNQESHSARKIERTKEAKA